MLKYLPPLAKNSKYTCKPSFYKIIQTGVSRQRKEFERLLCRLVFRLLVRSGRVLLNFYLDYFTYRPVRPSAETPETGSGMFT